MRLLAALPLLLVLAGCGSERDSEPRAELEPSATPAEATTSAAPEFIESETCRRKMLHLVDIMLANQTDAESRANLNSSSFEARVDELERKIDRALVACSNAVNKPARMVMYRFALGRLQWDYCDKDACMGPAEKSLHAGFRAAEKVEAALVATS